MNNIRFTNNVDIGEYLFLVGPTGPYITDAQRRVVNQLQLQSTLVSAAADGVLDANNNWSGINTFALPIYATGGMKTNTIGNYSSLLGDNALTIDSGQNIGFVNVPSSAREPTEDAHLATKKYVDSVTPVSSYLLYLNKTDTFGATGATGATETFSVFSPIQNISVDISNTTICDISNNKYLIGGFYNNISNLQFGSSIPAGIWVLRFYTSCPTLDDAEHTTIKFELYKDNTLIAESAQSDLISVISPVIGSYSTDIIAPLIDLTGNTTIGIKMYAVSNENSRSITTHYQSPSHYSTLQTPTTVQVATNILSTNNIWAGSNQFNSTIEGTIASSIQIKTTATDATTLYPLFVNNTITGYKSLYTDIVAPNISYNATTGVLNANINATNITGANITANFIGATGIVATNITCANITATNIATPLMQATVLTGQSIYANTITGATNIATPLMQATVLTGQSIYANTITGATNIATPLLQAMRITGQSIYANTITGQSIYITNIFEQKIENGSTVQYGYQNNINGFRNSYFGYQAGAGGSTEQDVVAVGYQAGYTGQYSQSVAIGSQSGQYNQCTGAVAIGYRAGYSGQYSYSVAIGFQSGYDNQGTSTVAIGSQSGQYRQRTDAVAIGSNAGQIDQGLGAVALGGNAGQNGQQHYTVAIGSNAGYTNQDSNAVAIGAYAGYKNQGDASVAIGAYAGGNQSLHSVAIGSYSNAGPGSVCMGYSSGNTNNLGFAVAMGYFAGAKSQGAYAVAVGVRAGETNQGQYAVAIGSNAGQTGQGANAIAIGANAGQTNQGSNSIAIGSNINCTVANSIYLNATSSLVSAATSGAFYVNPVRSSVGVSGGVLLYDDNTKEIARNPNVYYLNNGYLCNNTPAGITQAGIQLKALTNDGGYMNLFHATTATNTITNGNFIDVSGSFIIRRDKYPYMLSMLDFDASGNAFFNKTTDGSSDPTLTIKNSTNDNNKISFIPYSGAGAYNPIVQLSDKLIFSSNGVGASNIVLTTHSGTSSGIRISSDKVVLGYGGGSIIPTNNITIDATGINLNGAVGCDNINANGLITTGGNLQLTGGTAIVYSGTPTTNLQLQGPQAATTYGIKMFVGTPSTEEAMNIIPTGTGTTSLITMKQPTTIETNITANLPSMTIKQYGNLQSINFTPIAATGTAVNPICVVPTPPGTSKVSIISSNGEGDVDARFALTVNSTTTVGIRMGPVSMVMGAGGTAMNPANYLAFTGTTVVFECNTTLPTIQGAYALLAGDDSSTKIATTAWVQTAIPLGTSATANMVKLQNTGTGTIYLVMASASSGPSVDLLTDAQSGGGATYNCATNTADINITGTATHVAGGLAGQILFQSAPNTTAKLANGTSGYILKSNGSTSDPSWTADIVGNAGTATNVAGGSSGQILYQSAPNTTTFSSSFSYSSTTTTLTVGSVNTTSDYRIKQNVQPITDNIDALNPVAYYNTHTKRQDFGFIAHEVQEHFPMLVSGEKDGPVNQSINYIGIISILVAEIQELKKKVDMLMSNKV